MDGMLALPFWLDATVVRNTVIKIVATILAWLWFSRLAKKRK